MNQNRQNTSATVPLANEWHKRAISRSNCYGLLVLIFRDVPTSEVVAQLKAAPLAETLGHLGYDLTQDLAGELETVTERLCEQYTQTFVGPGPCVSPYASVHHRDEGRLWGDSTVRVKRFVEMTGLSFNDNWQSIPDHIAIELELMQRLAAHEAQLWSNLSDPSLNRKNVGKRLYHCLQAQEQFLRDHLCKWIPQFCGRVLEISCSRFYQKMASLTEAIVLADVEQVVAAQSVL
jgi:TorA maturation chaperone TorD